MRIRMTKMELEEKIIIIMIENIIRASPVIAL